MSALRPFFALLKAATRRGFVDEFCAVTGLSRLLRLFPTTLINTIAPTHPGTPLPVLNLTVDLSLTCWRSKVGASFRAGTPHLAPLTALPADIPLALHTSSTPPNNCDTESPTTHNHTQ
jgi:hypothetical protein